MLAALRPRGVAVIGASRDETKLVTAWCVT
jgi:acyl-CoA synthetase (NDP forming)